MQEYINTDQRLHLLSQILAKANRTYVPKMDDDSHTNLAFDFLGNRIIGRWVDCGKEKMLLALNLSNLHFEWINNSYQAIATVSSIGKTLPQIEADISTVLQKSGLNTTEFATPLHFEITQYAFAEDQIRQINSNCLREWCYYRKLVNEACAWVLGNLQQESEIRIWPHHFDTGIYTILNQKMSLGFGLAMADPMVGAPYFYFSPYPLKGTVDYSNLPTLENGRWEISENWKGAVLPLSEVNRYDQNKAEKTVGVFLQKTLNWLVNL